MLVSPTRDTRSFVLSPATAHKMHMGSFGRIVVIRRTGDDGSAFPVNQQVVSFGRDQSCTIRVRFEEVSRFHCKLLVDPVTRMVSIEDTSSNGTIVNGEDMGGGLESHNDSSQRPHRILNHMDIFTIHTRSFRFEYPDLNEIQEYILANPSTQLLTPKRVIATHQELEDQRQIPIHPQHEPSRTPSSQQPVPPATTKKHALVAVNLPADTPSKRQKLSSLDAVPTASCSATPSVAQKLLSGASRSPTKSCMKRTGIGATPLRAVMTASAGAESSPASITQTPNHSGDGGSSKVVSDPENPFESCNNNIEEATKAVLESPLQPHSLEFEDSSATANGIKKDQNPMMDTPRPTVVTATKSLTPHPNFSTSDVGTARVASSKSEPRYLGATASSRARMQPGGASPVRLGLRKSGVVRGETTAARRVPPPKSASVGSPEVANELESITAGSVQGAEETPAVVDEEKSAAGQSDEVLGGVDESQDCAGQDLLHAEGAQEQQETIVSSSDQAADDSSATMQTDAIVDLLMTENEVLVGGDVLIPTVVGNSSGDSKGNDVHESKALNSEAMSSFQSSNESPATETDAPPANSNIAELPHDLMNVPANESGPRVVEAGSDITPVEPPPQDGSTTPRIEEIPFSSPHQSVVAPGSGGGRKKVQFGPELSPQIFQKTLPASTPYRRGEVLSSEGAIITATPISTVASGGSSGNSIRKSALRKTITHAPGASSPSKVVKCAAPAPGSTGYIKTGITRLGFATPTNLRQGVGAASSQSTSKIPSSLLVTQPRGSLTMSPSKRGSQWKERFAAPVGILGGGGVPLFYKNKSDAGASVPVSAPKLAEVEVIAVKGDDAMDTVAAVAVENGSEVAIPTSPRRSPRKLVVARGIGRKSSIPSKRKESAASFVESESMQSHNPIAVAGRTDPVESPAETAGKDNSDFDDASVDATCASTALSREVSMIVGDLFDEEDVGGVNAQEEEERIVSPSSLALYKRAPMVPEDDGREGCESSGGEGFVVGDSQEENVGGLMDIDVVVDEPGANEDVAAEQRVLVSEILNAVQDSLEVEKVEAVAADAAVESAGIEDKEQLEANQHIRMYPESLEPVVPENMEGTPDPEETSVAKPKQTRPPKKKSAARSRKVVKATVPEPISPVKPQVDETEQIEHSLVAKDSEFVANKSQNTAVSGCASDKLFQEEEEIVLVRSSSRQRSRTVSAEAHKPEDSESAAEALNRSSADMNSAEKPIEVDAINVDDSAKQVVETIKAPSRGRGKRVARGIGKTKSKPATVHTDVEDDVNTTTSAANEPVLNLYEVVSDVPLTVKKGNKRTTKKAVAEHEGAVKEEKVVEEVETMKPTRRSTRVGIEANTSHVELSGKRSSKSGKTAKLPVDSERIIDSDEEYWVPSVLPPPPGKNYVPNAGPFHTHMLDKRTTQNSVTEHEGHVKDEKIVEEVETMKPTRRSTRNQACREKGKREVR